MTFCYICPNHLKRKGMTLEEKKMEFAVFCIENVASRLNELPEDIYERLSKQGLIDDLLWDCYDALHTQSKQHIVEDVINALDSREKGGQTE